MRGVLENTAAIDGLTQSFADGTYSSHDCDTRMNSTLAAMPAQTARCAVFLPATSLRISVTRKVVANRMLPSVISMPNASTKIITSMFAAMVANTVNAIMPPVPNR